MTTSLRASALTIAAAIGFTLMSAIAAPSAQADQQTHTLVLTQQPPSLRPVDQGAPGASVADIVLYEAPISDENGEMTASAPQLRAVAGGTGSFSG